MGKETTLAMNYGRLIERILPVNFINQITRIEVHDKKPIYEIHRWWARRPGTVFRAILLATFLDGSTDMATFEKSFYQRTSLGGKIVLDPFAGGGTTIVEGNRLNCKVIGIDLNPVAWFIMKKELDRVDTRELREAYTALEKRIASKIKKYYKTTCPQCGSEAEIVYTFWVRKAKCPTCGTNVHLFASPKIAEIKGKTAWIFCPNCQTIFLTKAKPDVICTGCGTRLSLRKKGVQFGSCICPSCGQHFGIKKSITGSPEFDMFAIEYYCPVCKTRAYKNVSKADVDTFEQAKKELEKKREKLIFPRQLIPDGKEVRRLFNYNYRYFYQFFNERQLLSLSLLLEEILKIENQNVKEFLLLAFSDCLDYNNMFARYNQKARKIEPMFAHHAFYPKNMPCENNVWGTKYGRCSFSKCFEKMLRAKMYCKRTYELQVKGEGTKRIYLNSDSIDGRIVESFDELIQNEGNVLLRCQTSEDLAFIPDKSVDAVVTDPPYFDNVMYSELADFYYVWLRIGLSDEYKYFKSEYCPRSEEIVVNEVKNKGESFYIKGLTKIFAECHKVLKDEGLLVFTFHHRKDEAWSSVLKAVLDAGFYIVAVYPVYSEMRTSFHIMGKEAISYDTVVVCRKQLKPTSPASWPYLLDEALMYARKAVAELVASHSDLTREDISVIIKGKCLELYSKHYPNVTKDGCVVSILDALKEADSKIQSILQHKTRTKNNAKDSTTSTLEHFFHV